MKKTITWLTMLLILILTGLPAMAADYQVEDTSRKVYDYAGLLTENEYERLEAAATGLSNEYKADFVVVTITENDRVSAQDFADRFFDDNYFGQKDGKREYGKGDGMLFLIDMQNREFALSTSGIVYKAMGQKDVDELLDAVVSPMRGEDYYKACFQALEMSAADLKSYQASRIWIPILAALVFAGVVTAIVLGVLVSFSKKSAPAAEAGRYVVPGSLHIARQNEWMTGSHTAVTPIPKSDGGSGGGGGSHTSSGGATHGGGSRSF